MERIEHPAPLTRCKTLSIQITQQISYRAVRSAMDRSSSTPRRPQRPVLRWLLPAVVAALAPPLILAGYSALVGYKAVRPPRRWFKTLPADLPADAEVVFPTCDGLRLCVYCCKNNNSRSAFWTSSCIMSRAKRAPERAGYPRLPWLADEPGGNLAHRAGPA